MRLSRRGVAALLLLSLSVIVGLGIVLNKRPSKAPEPAASPAATSTAPVAPAAPRPISYRALNGKMETLNATGPSDQFPTPSSTLREAFRQGDVRILETDTANGRALPLLRLDRQTGRLAALPFSRRTLIGRQGDELFFFDTTRQGDPARTAELDRITAVKLSDGETRVLETLPEGLSYTRTVEPGDRQPSGRASLANGSIRAEAYFASPDFRPGTERLPVELHAIPLKEPSRP